MKLRSLLLLSVAAALPVHSAPPGLTTGGLGSSLRGSGPITSASGTMTVLPGAKSMRGLSFDAHSTASGGSSEGGGMLAGGSAFEGKSSETDAGGRSWP